MKKLLVLFVLMFAIFACTNECLNEFLNECLTESNLENNSGNNQTDIDNPVKNFTTLQQVVNDTNAGEEIDLSQYKDLTDYSATVNKTLTIKNGSLNNAKLQITGENVKLEKIEKVSVSTSSRLTITNSKLSDLLIGGSGETSRSTPSSSEMTLAMVTVTDCEIENVELNGFNSQLNITDKTTKIEDILISTKAKVILESGSYEGMKAPTVINDGEVARVDMTKKTELSVLSIYSSPQKLEYNIGDKIDLAGLIVMGTYFTDVETFKSGGWKGESSDTITKWEDEKDYTVSYDFNIPGVSIVTVTSTKYPEIKCNFHVFVKELQNSGTSQPEKEEIEITEIELRSFGTPKTLYKVGEKLDLSCYQVVGTYNGFEINLPFTSEPLNGSDLKSSGEITVTFYYDYKPVSTQTITVTESYTVTFKDGEKTLYTLKVAGGELLKLPVVNERIGYTFDGWYKDDGTKIEAGDEVTGDITLHAKWTANTYTVKFNANGGSGTMTAQTFTYDVEQALTANAFTREDYTFAGWAVKADGTATYADMAKVKNLTSENKATVTLYAVWNEKDKVLPVVFSLPSKTAVDCGDSVTLSCATEGAKISYTIGEETAEYTNAITITKNVTITAFATKDGMKGSDESTASYTVKTYTVTFNSDYGTAPSDVTGLKKGDTLTAEQLPKLTITGYTFAGWYNGENEITTEYKISSDLELSAKWTANTDTAYKIEHYQQNINDNQYSLKDTENKTGTTGEDTSATAKTYAGFTAKTIEQMKIAANGSTVVKIYYDRNTIMLTLNLDGGEGKTEITGKYGAVVTTPANPTKTGYTFAEWNPSLPSTYSAENATYTAKWTADTYAITYKLNDGENNTANPRSYNVETETITLSSPTRTGYTFGGWYTDEAFANVKTQIAKGSTGNITLYAKWTKIEEKISVELPVYTEISGLTGPTTNTNGTVTFTAPSGYSNCNWYVDGDLKGQSGNEFTLNTSDMNGGIYTVMVVVTDSNGDVYSAEYRLTISK